MPLAHTFISPPGFSDVPTALSSSSLTLVRRGHPSLAWLAKPIKNGDTFLPRDQGEMHSIKIDIHVSLLKVAFPFSSSLQLC